MMQSLSRKSKPIFFLSIALCVIVIGGTISILDNNYMWSVLFLNSYLVFIFISNEYFYTRRIISYGIVFNGYWWLYTNIYLIEQLASDQLFNKYDFTLVLLSLLSMLCFNLFYSFTIIRKRKAGNNNNKKRIIIEKGYNLNRLIFFLSLILLVAMVMQFYVIFVKIGVNSFVFNTRSGRSLVVAPFRKFMFFEDFLILTSVLSYYIKTFKKSKSVNLIFCFSIINSVTLSILTISRTNFIMLILPILFIASYKKKISNRTIIVSLISVLILFVFWKSLLSGFIFNGSLNLEMGNFSGEFTTWYRIGNNVLTDIHSRNISYLYGQSYIDTLINLITPFTNIEPLSIWYVKNYEYQTYLIGGGRGFSGIIEGYLNFPIVGNILFFMFLGIIFKKIENAKFLDMKYLIIYSISLPYIQRIFRSESYSLFKTWWWFYVLVILIVFGLSKKRSKNVKHDSISKDYTLPY